MSSVSLSGISKSFGPLRVLRDIHLPIDAGDFTVLLGPSGCGKSTLLNVIAGLEDINAGIVEIDGTDARSTNRANAASQWFFSPMRSTRQ